MWREVKKRLSIFLIPLLGFAMVGYFIYHVLQGDRGLFAMLRVLNELEEAQALLKKVEKEKAKWENRVSLLRPQKLDKDMLDEQVRRQLGFVASDEVAILREQPPASETKKE